jgi:biopolymer transport protein ExbD
MKVQGAKKVHYDSGPNMTPLVDVVMVILIFLMLAGSFAGSTRYLMSKAGFHATGKSTGKPPVPDPNQPPDINIRVDVVPGTMLNQTGGFIAQSQSPKIGPTSSETTLQSQLEQVKDKMVSSGTPLDKLQIVLQPGRGVKYQFLLQVYEASLQAGFTKVALATSH